ncbi:MAG TPA: hypothetical protein VMB84_12035, partial [Stellaceae bacterium]|nr:hypothetical protein [Stellaceae bacterium]
MAINALTLAWLDRLRQRGILSGGAVLDLGPQDLIACPREAVLVSARRWHAPELADRLVEAIYDGDRFRQIGG